MSNYAQRYIHGLLDQVARVMPVDDAPRNIGEIAPSSRQPHVALYLRLLPGLCLATTAGLAERATPLPLHEGIQSFELCALTTFDDPQLLWLLSNVGAYLLASSAPLLYGDPGAEPRSFLPYETIQLGGDDTRMLLVPRWTFTVLEGPRVEVIEPLPITDAQCSELEPLPREDRGQWVARMGSRTVNAWSTLFERLSD